MQEGSELCASPAERSCRQRGQQEKEPWGPEQQAGQAGTNMIQQKVLSDTVELL